MSETNQKNYNMIDNAAGVCAGVATYKFIESHFCLSVYSKSGGLIRLGCQLVQAYCGIKMGVAVRDEVHKLRTGLSALKSNGMSS